MLFNLLKTKFKYSQGLSKKQLVVFYFICVLFLFIGISFLILKILNSISFVKNFIIKIDFSIINLIKIWRTENLNRIMEVITQLGEWKIIVGMAIVLLIIFGYKKKWHNFVLLTTSLIGSEIIIYSIKNLIKRGRPLFISIISENGFSFPSGHSLIAVSFYGILAYFLIKKFPKRWQKFIIWIAAIFLILTISFSRIYLGVHWFSDVAAGIIGGIVWLLILINFSRQMKKNEIL